MELTPKPGANLNRSGSTGRPVLLTVSGTIDPGINDAIAHGQRPRADYLELADACTAEIIDFRRATDSLGRVGRLLERLGWQDAALALACLRRQRQHQVVFTDSERVGMLLAIAWRLDPRRRRPRHVMIGHRLSPPKKVLIHRLLGLHRAIDRVVVYSSAQRDVAVERLGYGPEQVVLTPFMVDCAFWSNPPAGTRSGDRHRPMVCSVGLELRDYEALVGAVRGLDVEVVIAAASPWSKRPDSSAGVALPENVNVVKLDQFHLRELYRAAGFVVVPLVESDFQAGITTILEAMAMGLAVVCTRTAGQIDTLTDRETGVYVPPGDPDALREAIVRLLQAPDEAARLGRAGQRWARQHADIEVYSRRLREVVEAVAPAALPTRNGR